MASTPVAPIIETNNMAEKNDTIGANIRSDHHKPQPSETTGISRSRALKVIQFIRALWKKDQILDNPVLYQSTHLCRNNVIAGQLSHQTPEHALDSEEPLGRARGPEEAAIGIRPVM